MKKFCIILLFNWIALGMAWGKVSLPKLFSDNMVLQREMRVPIWGWADPGENIRAELDGHVAETTAGSDGKWKLYLGPLNAGGPFQLTIKGSNSITLQNVLVGEVWVCSGQSNMSFEVRDGMNAKQEISNANYPQIRHFQVARRKSLKPLEDVSPVDNPKASELNKWEVCSPSTVGQFTAVGYFFGLNLYKKLNVPIGLIHASWGGTTAEAWTPHDTLETDPELKLILKHWPDYNNDEQWLREEYEKFVKDVEKAQKQETVEPLYFNQPSVLYNGIIAPIVPYGIRGVTWYQGESNAYRSYQYRNLLPALIKKWRNNWGEGNFPFLIVQLANYNFEPQVFPELREAQSMALSLPNTAMAVAIDLGDSSNIHPKNKQEVSRRLYLAADNIVYGNKTPCSGPVFKSMKVTGHKCRLSFRNIEEGLITKGSKNLEGFFIAGKDHKFIQAQAIIKGENVVVWSKLVPHPVAVRYAWANFPRSCNLYNKLGLEAYLPTSPFRTDNWPGITDKRK